MTVSFQYYSENEDGRDDYRFSSEAEAMEKFEPQGDYQGSVS